MDSHYLAIRGTIPYRLTTAFQEGYRVRSTLILADHSLVLRGLPTSLIHMKEGKFCRYVHVTILGPISYWAHLEKIVAINLVSHLSDQSLLPGKKMT